MNHEKQVITSSFLSAALPAGKRTTNTSLQDTTLTDEQRVDHLLPS